MEKLLALFDAVDACAERLEDLHSKFPDLATHENLESVANWRQRKQQMKLQMGIAGKPKGKVEMAQGKPELAEVKALAASLLDENGLEECLDILLAEHRVDLTMPELIRLVGKRGYIEALRRDARMLLANAISYDQIASLWNDLERPAFSGPKWEARTVSQLLE